MSPRSQCSSHPHWDPVFNKPPYIIGRGPSVPAFKQRHTPWEWDLLFLQLPAMITYHHEPWTWRSSNTSWDPMFQFQPSSGIQEHETHYSSHVVLILWDPVFKPYTMSWCETRCSAIQHTGHKTWCMTSLTVIETARPGVPASSHIAIIHNNVKPGGVPYSTVRPSVPAIPIHHHTHQCHHETWGSSHPHSSSHRPQDHLPGIIDQEITRCCSDTPWDSMFQKFVQSKTVRLGIPADSTVCWLFLTVRHARWILLLQLLYKDTQGKI